MPSSSPAQDVFKKPLKPLSAQPRFTLPSFASTSSTRRRISSAASELRSTKLKGKGKEKEIEVIDLTEDDSSASIKASKRANLSHTLPDGLWVDLYPPTDRDSLAVHKKKVLDVAGWFDEAWRPGLAKWRRVLVLSGPAGAGKTATIKVLANELGVDVLEWRNGGNWEVANDDGRESLVHQFTSFLARAGMAPALDLGPDPSAASLISKPLSSTSKSSSTSSGPRLILLEDLPNTSHYPTRLAFRSAILQFLASPRVTCPLVIVISEALARPGIDAIENGGGGGASWAAGGGDVRNESYDARSVLGNELLLQPGVREIKFNAIAPTVMKKPLVTILDRVYAAHQDGKPSVGAVEQVIAHSKGDLRSALMSLQFLANCDVQKWAGGDETKGKKGKKRKSDGSVVASAGAGREEVKKLLHHVTSRESSLFVFHALGKVLYSKRWSDSAEDDKKDLDRPGILQQPSTPLPRLPRHLRQNHTRQPSKVDPDVLFAEAPLDSDLFLSYLHHNYPAFTTDIEQCSSIIDAYSGADSLMRLEGDDFIRRVPLTSQYSFALATRATLFHLPTPVPKRKQVLRKSEMWDQLKRTRENEAMLEMFARKGFVGEAMRISKEVRIELAPFVGMMMRSGKGEGMKKQPFLVELANFPPPPSSATEVIVRGEALEEKETLDEDAAEAEEEDAMDVEEQETFEEVVEEELFDVDDDIED